MSAGGMATVRGRLSVRSFAVGIGATAALAVFGFWTVRQARLTNEALSRAIAAEKAAARAQTGVDRAQAGAGGQIEIKSRDSGFVRAVHRPTKADSDRARQLSDEIMGLTQMQEKVEQDLYQLRAKAARALKNPPPSYPLP